MKIRSGAFYFSRYLLSLLLLALLISPLDIIAQKKKRPAAAPTGLTKAQRINHVLSRLTFGARPGDYERVDKMGVDAFIEQQLNYESIDESEANKRLAGLSTLMLPTPLLAEQYNPPPPPKPSPTPTPAASPTVSPTPIPSPTSVPSPEVKPSPTASPKPTPAPKNPQMVVTELQRAKLLRAVYGERQLYEVMVDLWMNHFSIFSGKDADRWMLTGFDRDSIRPFAMGRFRDLLGATTRSPAMLYYLDNWQSSVVRSYPATKDRPARLTGGINENYARELMELHTMGVGGGYTQHDVQEVARCFTGWTIRNPAREGSFMFHPAQHDNGEKTVLGQKIPAGGGIGDAEKVLDILAKHPSTAKFIATKLARRFIADEPPAEVVDAAAKVFLKTDGSIRETLRAVITSKAFFGKMAYRAKIRSPFEFTAAVLRATGAKTDANRPVLDWVARMGQPVFGHRTPEGFPEKGDAWLSNNGLLARINFASALATGQIRGTTVDPVAMFPAISDPAAVISHLKQVILSNEALPATIKELDELAVDPPAASAPAVMMPASSAAKPPGSDKKKTPAYVVEGLILALGAPEFQRR